MRPSIFIPTILIIFTLFFTGHLSASDSTSVDQKLVLRIGYLQNQYFSANEYVDTYNNDNAFPRPLIVSAQSWPEFDPFGGSSGLNLVASIEIDDRILLSVSFQRQKNDYIDEFGYSGIISLVDANNRIIGQVEDVGLKETYQFNTQFTPLIFSLEYRFLSSALVSPVIGIGVGTAFWNFGWEWQGHRASFVHDGTTYVIPNENLDLFSDSGNTFIYQPRLRLELNLNRLSERWGRFFDHIYLQYDYIASRQEVDIFRGFRSEFFQGFSQDDFTAEAQRMFDEYEIKWGGSQISLGVAINTGF